MTKRNVKNRPEARMASPATLLRKLNRSLQVGCVLALATVSQCNYVPTSNSTQVECCEPVEDIADCPCIIITDVAEG